MPLAQRSISASQLRLAVNEDAVPAGQLLGTAYDPEHLVHLLLELLRRPEAVDAQRAEEGGPCWRLRLRAGPARTLRPSLDSFAAVAPIAAPDRTPVRISTSSIRP